MDMGVFFDRGNLAKSVMTPGGGTGAVLTHPLSGLSQRLPQQVQLHDSFTSHIAMLESMKPGSSVFDILLALCFPLLVVLVGRQLLPPFPWSDIRQLLLGFHIKTSHPFSSSRAYSSYVHYGSLAKQEATAMERSYVSVGRAHKHLGYKIGYLRKLNRLKEAVAVNINVTTSIATLAAQELSLEDSGLSETNQADLSRVREPLKHFVRDWSEEGAREREKIFRPVLRLLEQVPLSERAGLRVLVPGSGLGRLAWEISQLGESWSLSFVSNHPDCYDRLYNECC